MATDGCILKAAKPLSARLPASHGSRRPATAKPVTAQRLHRRHYPWRTSSVTPAGANLLFHTLGRTDCRVKQRIKLLSSTYLSQGAARPHTPYQQVAQHHH